jgi:hypothetical protein
MEKLQKIDTLLFIMMSLFNIFSTAQAANRVALVVGNSKYDTLITLKKPKT